MQLVSSNSNVSELTDQIHEYSKLITRLSQQLDKQIAQQREYERLKA